MKPLRAFFSLAGTLALTTAALVPTAEAAPAVAAAATGVCKLEPGSVLRDGTQINGGITVDYPPRTIGLGGPVFGVFDPGVVRLSTSFTSEVFSTAATNHGWVVAGDSLYYREYTIDGLNEFVPDWPNVMQRIGGGWSSYRAVEVSQYTDRTTAYGLRDDGTLFRWSVGGGWRRTGSATGFSAVKSMALISKTATYDTFIANTRGGALYTIRIPVTAPMQPVVTKVRASTWQGFEKLLASKCGYYGTLLVGIDKDTRTAHTYAVGHANGLATVINHLEANGPRFDAPVYFRWGGVPSIDPLTGD